ncbi:hypothetical protein H072_502 [Dactylellina haptotyla CBS 200.50]|uniref:BTB domain-containing protein n=1 Tax=Dactylellina haptotyla (strain CBS 200.50) TaxID=1284197 RepID=S8ARL0_DACHA|nr:hypothetical protein H072_502 [Dactylellina haptotyla CBS 200.50]
MNLRGFMDYDAEKVVDLYAAADYLQISDLKTSLLRWVGNTWQERSELIENETELKPYQVIQSLCVHSQLSDWPLLRECVRAAKPSVGFQASDLVELAKGEPGSAFLLALMVELSQCIINKRTCTECQIKYDLYDLSDEEKCLYCSNLCKKAPFVARHDLEG